jgi:hypothetical protein
MVESGLRAVGRPARTGRTRRRRDDRIASGGSPSTSVPARRVDLDSLGQGGGACRLLLRLEGGSRSAGAGWLVVRLRSRSRSTSASTSTSTSTSTSASNAFVPLRGHESLSLACPRESNQREGPPGNRASPALQSPCPALLAGTGPARTRTSMCSNMRALLPFPSALLGAIYGDSTAQQQQQQQQTATLLMWWRAQRCHIPTNETSEAGALIEARVWLLALNPRYFTPSSGGIRRGKARMFERRDARVRAGRRISSNAGHGARCLRATGNPGCPSLWSAASSSKCNAWVIAPSRASPLRGSVPMQMSVAAFSNPASFAAEC